MLSRLFGIAALVAFVSAQGWAAGDEFIGRLILDFTAGPRDGVVVEQFGYKDPAGRSWIVPPGTVVDGASIPQPLWSIIGGPWEGEYRKASVIHDYYCTTMDRGWRNVHRVFYDAMITGGVSPLKAKLMYAAVVYFGPKWKIEYGIDNKPIINRWQHPYDQDEFRTLQTWITDNDPTLEAIEALVKD